MAALFGTDGVRGLANVDLTPELALALGRAAGESLSFGPILVGRDTRRSGPMLSLAFQAGAHSVGIDTVDVGVLPSGGIAQLVAVTDATMGAVVTASHNPAPDNGIKLIAHSGNKLPDSVEDAIEARYRRGAPYRAPIGAAIGMARTMDDAIERYLDLLGGTSTGDLGGLPIVLDCANGAAHLAAPALFRRLGAEVEVRAADPDGLNINDGCGATHPEALAPFVAGRVGLCFDGDADRLIAIDEDGVPANGDVIMAVLARHLNETGRLPGGEIVATVMSNLGFKQAMRSIGLVVHETQVGDRYVLEEMLRTGAALGGEQSGHIVLEDRMSGDGLRTALRLLEVMVTTGAELRELRRVMTEFPQVLQNVLVADKSQLAGADQVWSAVADAEASLGEDGRILVRASGTEPLVRVMVEAPSARVAEDLANSLSAVVSAALA